MINTLLLLFYRTHTGIDIRSLLNVLYYMSMSCSTCVRKVFIIWLSTSLILLSILVNEESFRGAQVHFLCKIDRVDRLISQLSQINSHDDKLCNQC